MNAGAFLLDFCKEFGAKETEFLGETRFLSKIPEVRNEQN
jgi:hypothetical protein